MRSFMVIVKKKTAQSCFVVADGGLSAGQVADVDCVMCYKWKDAPAQSQRFPEPIWMAQRWVWHRSVLHILDVSKVFPRTVVKISSRISCRGNIKLSAYNSDSLRFVCFFSHTLRVLTLPTGNLLPVLSVRVYILLQREKYGKAGVWDEWGNEAHCHLDFTRMMLNKMRSFLKHAVKLLPQCHEFIPAAEKSFFAKERLF